MEGKAMKSVFVKMALSMLRDALLAALTAEKVDAVLDAAIDKVLAAVKSLLADYPELLLSVEALGTKAKEGQAIAEALVRTLTAILDALQNGFGAAPAVSDDDVELLEPVAADLTALQLAAYPPSE